MKITVNGTVQDTTAPSLDALLIELGYGAAKVATAVNESFVPAAMRPEHRLNDGDRIEIVAPRQGG
ncbi:thiamine biosynthesis protein ThiS [Roseovarius sp. TM1035]|jgi:sulfur carrier protein|uniref:sulfur carrier protein ThiS n=1 Tax=Roseovarius sp. TM1035 TaxID=391613 RepID=UPI000155721E|nr:sulfur carrier protein ThiS [Roseovarius sp. TM1035]AWZ19983.1 Sulfur carrier protein ThiS [Roseovarius sp. AK1035]EDM31501.1 thiamine biosynthesis protein ThiS [Roseovarius sp. TM1035]